MTATTASIDHPQRRALNDEVHARPPGNLPTPCTLSYLAKITPPEDPDSVASLAELLRLCNLPEPERGKKHLVIELPGMRLRWERHTEFSRYVFIGGEPAAEPFAESPMLNLPQEWLTSLKDDVITAVQVGVIPLNEDQVRLSDISDRYFGGNTLIGSHIAGGRAIAVTDFRIPTNGFMRLLILNDAMSDAQTGRQVQRILEIDAYRMMALLALPVAHDLTPRLDKAERELVDINEALVEPSPNDETDLLARLTLLAAENQGRHIRSDFRFAAANAYYELVLQRITELRESRITGLQTFDEFTQRRLTPAIKTCHAVARRQESLVTRMARATQLLSTRVDVERQAQNQQLLESMDRRVKSQLRLQATVEGLSVAAVTYYVVGLVAIMAEGLQTRGYPVDPVIAAALSVPIVAGIAFYGLRRIRRHISEEAAS